MTEKYFPKSTGFSASDLGTVTEEEYVNPLGKTEHRKIKKSIPQHLWIFLIIFFTGIFGTGLFVLESTTQEPQQLATDASPLASQPPLSPTPTVNPLSSWKTFKNKSLSVTYPPFFTVNDTTVLTTSPFPTIYDHVLFRDNKTTVSITIAANTQNLTLGTALGKGPFIAYPSSSLLNKTPTYVRIDGIQGIKAENIISSQSATITDIMLINKTKVYQITLTPVTAENTQLLNDMLSSIKLLNIEDDELAGWKTYTDTKYKYTFRYPLALDLVFTKATQGALPHLVHLSDPKNPSTSTSGTLSIEAQDPTIVGQSDVTSRTIMGLSLQKFVNEKWKLNIDDTTVTSPLKSVGFVTPIKLAGIDGYSFTVIGQWKDDRQIYSLPSEHIYEFVENKGMKFMLWHPTSSASAQFKQVRDTFSFTE
jgi:hypothetical protein